MNVRLGGEDGSLGAGRGRIVVNLDMQFEGLDRTEAWLTELSSLAEVGESLDVSPTPHNPEGTTHQTKAAPQTLIRCVLGGPNRVDGRSCPDEVWV